jgi:hypothetical protein
MEMLTMTTATILVALWPSIRRILGKLGRWVIDMVSRKGAAVVAGYLELRTEVFERRRTKARSQVRRSWLVGRIRRWKAAARWLRGTEGQKLRGKVVDLAVERAQRELAEHATEESFKRRRRAA